MHPGLEALCVRAEQRKDGLSSYDVISERPWAVPIVLACQAVALRQIHNLYNDNSTETTLSSLSSSMDAPLLAVDILVFVLVFLGVTPLIADFNRSHLTNPLWMPHARFHCLWQVLQNAAICGLCVYSLTITIPTRAALQADPSFFFSSSTSTSPSSPLVYAYSVSMLLCPICLGNGGWELPLWTPMAWHPLQVLTRIYSCLGSCCFWLVSVLGWLYQTIIINSCCWCHRCIIKLSAL